MDNVVYYISTGQQTKMYTLRIRWTETCHFGAITRDQYIRNLSTDSEKAVANARMYLETSDTLVETQLESLQEIRRRESAEIQAHRIAQEEKYQAEQRAREQSLIHDIKNGNWPYGQFKHQVFNNADNSYILYFLKLECEDDNVLDALQKALTYEFPHLANLPKPNGEYYGTIKSREVFTATLIASYGFEGYYGYTHIAKFIKDTGELLMYMGGTCAAYKHIEIGESGKFKATIKEHDEYKGECQTVIQRLAAV